MAAGWWRGAAGTLPFEGGVFEPDDAQLGICEFGKPLTRIVAWRDGVMAESGPIDAPPARFDARVPGRRPLCRVGGGHVLKRERVGWGWARTGSAWQFVRRRFHLFNDDLPPMGAHRRYAIDIRALPRVPSEAIIHLCYKDAHRCHPPMSNPRTNNCRANHRARARERDTRKLRSTFR